LHIFSPFAVALVLSLEHKAEGVLAWKWFFFIILFCLRKLGVHLRKRELREKEKETFFAYLIIPSSYFSVWCWKGRVLHHYYGFQPPEWEAKEKETGIRTKWNERGKYICTGNVHEWICSNKFFYNHRMFILFVDENWIK
jgi:hypothetical protein